jgi:[ribosomal protein S5]-alanine N-acetyltransferase
MCVREAGSWRFTNIPRYDNVPKATLEPTPASWRSSASVVVRKQSSMRELRSCRLFLRPVRPDDYSTLQRHWSEPEVRRYLWDGQVVSTKQVREVVIESARLFEEYGAGLWTIELVSAADLIGCTGFWYFHEPPELEFLISLSPHYWGGGFAQEAAAVLLDYVFNELEWVTVQASADAPNVRSLRLMRRLGMRPAGERPGAFSTIEVYSITAAEWHGRARDSDGSA